MKEEEKEGGWGGDKDCESENRVRGERVNKMQIARTNTEPTSSRLTHLAISTLHLQILLSLNGHKHY